MACCFCGQGQFRKQLSYGCILILLAGLASLSAETLPTPSTTVQKNLEKHYLESMEPIQIVTLNAENEPFLGLFYDQLTASPQGAALILHDAGASADWPYLQRQIHRYLPEIGWSTLAISLPLPNTPLAEVRTGQGVSFMPQTTEQWLARMNARIAAALAELNSQGYFNIAIIAIGDSAYWAAAYLSERLNPLEEDGFSFIMINAPITYKDLPDIIGTLNISTLDLYMTDSSQAHQQARLRKAAAVKAQHPDYLQINDAPRQSFYSIPEIDRTTRRIWGWLRNHAAGLEAQLANNQP
jgi:hypothetical protein